MITKKVDNKKLPSERTQEVINQLEDLKNTSVNATDKEKAIIARIKEKSALLDKLRAGL